MQKRKGSRDAVTMEESQWRQRPLKQGPCHPAAWLQTGKQPVNSVPGIYKHSRLAGIHEVVPELCPSAKIAWDSDQLSMRTHQRREGQRQSWRIWQRRKPDSGAPPLVRSIPTYQAEPLHLPQPMSLPHEGSFL